MTAEGSQPAPQPAAPESVAPQSTGGQSANNQSVRIAALVVLGLVIVGVIVYLIAGHNSKKRNGAKGGHNSTAIGPQTLSANELKGKVPSLGGLTFWAGTKPAGRYELTRTTNDNRFVRYLPKGVPNAAPGKKYLVVATYPWNNPYKALQGEAKKGGRTLPGPGGSIIFVKPTALTSVYLAWPHRPYEVVVYDPKPAVAMQIAKSGAVTPIG